MNEETAKIIQHSIFINAEDTASDLRDGVTVSYSRNTDLDAHEKLILSLSNESDSEEYDKKRNQLSVNGSKHADRELVKLSFGLSSDSTISEQAADLFNSSIRKMVKDADLIPTIETDLNQEEWPKRENTPASNEVKVHYRPKIKTDRGEELYTTIFFDKANIRPIIKSAIENTDKVYGTVEPKPTLEAEIITTADFTATNRKEKSPFADKIIRNRGSVTDTADRFINKGSNNKDNSPER